MKAGELFGLTIVSPDSSPLKEAVKVCNEVSVKATPNGMMFTDARMTSMCH